MWTIVVAVLMVSSLLLPVSSDTTPATTTTSVSLLPPPCSLTSLEMLRLPSNATLAPCLLYDTDRSLNQSSSFDTVVTLLQVTATECAEARDGAPLAVSKLNAWNDGRGVPIGFRRNHFVGFRLLSVVAGHALAVRSDAYLATHRAQLENLLNYTTGQVRYIIGTCSLHSTVERAVALAYETVLMAQVGAPGFYDDNNPWVFGFHVSSDSYTFETVRQLQFYAELKRQESFKQKNLFQDLPVRVVYRTASQFFFSTCDQTLRFLNASGFTNVQQVLYDPSADHDQDGIENQIDVDFLETVADDVCPPGGSLSDGDFRPALFLCVLSEQDYFLQRWRDNQCLFSSVWMTPTAWPWAFERPTVVPFFQGSGQWHPAFQFRDAFFDSGRDVLLMNEQRLGYLGGSDTVVSYAIPTLFAEHLQSVYRILDDPNPTADNADPQRREQIRRLLLNIRGQTIFGPIVFNDRQQNQGREPASFQWLRTLVETRIPTTTTTTSNNSSSSSSPSTVVVNKTLSLVLVAPSGQAEGNLVLPAPTLDVCPAGSFVNLALVQSEPTLLESKCAVCPADTFAPRPNNDLQCTPCPPGLPATPDRTTCIVHDDNLLSSGIVAFGYCIMTVTWILALTFLAWTLRYRKDPVVKIAQPPYLVGICLGAVLSSSAIISFSQQAGTDQDDTKADRGCLMLPFLYSMGWVIQYGCVCAKTMRLWRIVDRPQWQRVHLTKTAGLGAVLVPLVLDILILVVWAIVVPLAYERSETGRTFNDDGFLVIQSTGRCRPARSDNDDDDNNNTNNSRLVWIFLGLILAVHASLMFSTHWLLYHVRNVNDRYQEHRYLSIAAAFALELVIMGIPILVAAHDSGVASYFVVCSIISLDTSMLLCFVFFPKMRFLKEGLGDGVGIGESILSETHQKAVIREAVRKQDHSTFPSHHFHVGGGVDRGTQTTESSWFTTKDEELVDEEESTTPLVAASKENIDTPAKMALEMVQLVVESGGGDQQQQQQPNEVVKSSRVSVATGTVDNDNGSVQLDKTTTTTTTSSSLLTQRTDTTVKEEEDKQLLAVVPGDAGATTVLESGGNKVESEEEEEVLIVFSANDNEENAVPRHDTTSG